jgi:hypothetical protein
VDESAPAGSGAGAGGTGSALGRVLEEIEESKAFYQVYDGAVYMYQVGEGGKLRPRGNALQQQL